MSMNNTNNYFQNALNYATSYRPEIPRVTMPSLPDASDINARIQQYTALNPPTPQKPDTSNILTNFGRNVGEWGTGLVNIVSHPVQTLETIGGAVEEGIRNPEKIVPTAWNLMADQYNLGTDDLVALITGQKNVGQFIGDVGQGLYEHPADALLDFTSFGGAKLVKALTKGTKIGRLARASEVVESALSVNNAKVARKAQVVKDTAKELEKSAKGLSDADVAEAVKAFETGGEVTRQELKPVLKNLKKYHEEYDDLVKNYSPETWESNNKLATIQRGVREGRGNYSEVEKTLLPYYDNPELFAKGTSQLVEEGGELAKTASGNKLSKAERANIIAEKERVLTPEGRVKLTEMANNGDEYARFILESEDLYAKGWLRPVTHGAAEVEKVGEVLGDVAKAGRFSQRAYGTASYLDIAKQLLKPNEWLDKQVASMVERQLANEILEKGTIGGEKIATQVGKETQYIPRDVIERGDLSDLSKFAKEAPSSTTDIAIDKATMKELEKQSMMLRSSNPFKKGTLLHDTFQTNKEVTLASGSYLAGNLQTGLMNMILNSNLNPVGLAADIAAAISSKNRLAKATGLYRNLERGVSRVKTPVLSTIDKINKPVGNFWNSIDAKTQNFFTEVALHNNLRKQGIGVANRESALLKMADDKLGAVINDAKKVSLINPTKTLLPKELYGVAGLMNPFWRWMDTAAQSSFYMLQKSPVLSNIVMVDLLSNIGINQEMANRAGMNVQSDKPFVSYRYNPRTKQVQEVSAEFVPMMNTMRLGGTLASVLSGKGKASDIDDVLGSSIPAVTAITNSFRGKTKYGKPILRSHVGLQDAVAVQGDKRYKKVNGQWVIDDKFYWDEPLTATTRELISWVPLMNRTVLPLASQVGSALTGQEQAYYRPYDNRIFGAFNVNPYNNTNQAWLWQGGNPARRVGAQETANMLVGQYTQNYFPERDNLSMNLARRLQRNAGMRELRNYMNIMGGQ